MLYVVSVFLLKVAAEDPFSYLLFNTPHLPEPHFVDFFCIEMDLSFISA